MSKPRGTHRYGSSLGGMVSVRAAMSCERPTFQTEQKERWEKISGRTLEPKWTPVSTAGKLITNTAPVLEEKLDHKIMAKLVRCDREFTKKKWIPV